MQKPSRPTGVTILAVLCILAAIGGILFGAGALVIGLVIGTYAGSQLTSSLASSGYSGLAALGAATIATFLIVVGVVFFVLGILYLAVAVGFLGGRGWSWTLGLIVSIINIVWSIIQIAFGSYSSAFGLVVGIIILYYLTRPHVKAFFGKGGAMAPSQMPPASM